MKIRRHVRTLLFYKALRTIQRLLISNAEILVLGDSHAEIFGDWRIVRALPRHYFRIASVGGATASGLDNPNSKTNAYSIFQRHLSLSTPTLIIIMLGEVDTGFVIWYRAQKYEADVSESLDQAVTKYSTFILNVNQRCKSVVVSTPLPTITDDNDWGEVANLRREVCASQRDRTELTLKFNARIKALCGDNDIHFIDLDAESLGDDGLVNPVLVNSNRSDHHYSNATYARLLLQHLIPLLT